MFRQSVRTLALLGAVLVAGCMTGAPEHPTQVQSVENDPFSPDIVINGADAGHAYPLVLDESFGWYIRSFINKSSHAVSHQLYFESIHPPPLSHFFAANDDTARAMPIVKIAATRDCDPRPCSDDEVVGVDLDDAVLRSRVLTGYAVKVLGRDGSQYILKMTPGMIKVQLDAVEEALASLGAPSLARRDTPQDNACPPMGVHVLPLTDKDPPRTEHPSLRGVRVIGVDSGSPAAKAGVVTGDVITEFNFAPIQSCQDLIVAITGTSRNLNTVDLRGTDAKGTRWTRNVSMADLVAAALTVVKQSDLASATAPAPVAPAAPPASQLKPPTLSLTETPEGPSIGVILAPEPIAASLMTGNYPRKGAYIAFVMPNSPAKLAGLTVNTVIVTYDGKPIDSAAALVEAVKGSGTGRQIPIEVVDRMGTRMTLMVGM